MPSIKKSIIDAKNNHSFNGEFLMRFQRDSLQFVGSLLDVTSSIFYLLDPKISSKGVARCNLRATAVQQYRTRYAELDPLNPKRFHGKSESVVTLDSQISFSMLRQSIYFIDFMKPLGHRYVVDLFFRVRGEVVAVISIVRSEEKKDFSVSEIEILKSLHSYIECVLNGVYLPCRYNERRFFQESYKLTRRETDVLEFIVMGYSNKLIANELGLGLATVKTHLINLYRKVEVSSRTELVYKIMRRSD